MSRTVTISKTRPVDWPEAPQVGTCETPYGTYTLTEKGVATTTPSGQPPVHMTAKKKHRRD